MYDLRKAIGKLFKNEKQGYSTKDLLSREKGIMWFPSIDGFEKGLNFASLRGRDKQITGLYSLTFNEEGKVESVSTIILNDKIEGIEKC
ncbi:hypothetical protein KAR91_29410 [Candidatus Pacearchaeota archaeon]|nr:hypothetical protein [Candidatus Pacearchaeota archaeon]